MLDSSTLCSFLGHSRETVTHRGGMNLRVKVTLAVFIVQPDLNLKDLSGTTHFSSNDSMNGEELCII